jgi:hypothetical protein
MERREVAVIGVVALVTAASWSASIAYDAGQREADSYAAGQRWAHGNQPDPAACEAEMLQIAGPEVIGGPWLAGCITSVAPEGVAP